MRPTLPAASLRLTFLLALCLTTLFAHADDSTGIQFVKGSWKAVLAEAKKRNKPIFVDVYTTWCGPCKLMEKQAFSDARVGKLMNANFVNYKLDAEKDEGMALAKHYVITGYPTGLYLSEDGILTYRHSGYSNIADFMAEVNKAIKAAKDGRPITTWDAEFEQRKRDPVFLKAYLDKRAKLGLPHANALNAYLAFIPEAEWTTKNNLLLAAGNLTTARSRVFELVLLKADSVSKNRESAERNNRVIAGLMDAVARDRKDAITEDELEESIQNARRVNRQLKGGSGPN